MTPEQPERAEAPEKERLEWLSEHLRSYSKHTTPSMDGITCSARFDNPMGPPWTITVEGYNLEDLAVRAMSWSPSTEDVARNAENSRISQEMLAAKRARKEAAND